MFALSMSDEGYFGAPVTEPERSAILADLIDGIVNHLWRNLPEVIIETVLTGIVVSVLVSVFMHHMIQSDARKKAKPLQDVALGEFNRRRRALTELLRSEISWFAAEPTHDQTAIGREQYLKRPTTELRLLRAQLAPHFSLLASGVYDIQRGPLMDTRALGALRVMVGDLKALLEELIDFIHAANHPPFEPTEKLLRSYKGKLRDQANLIAAIISRIYKFPKPGLEEQDWLESVHRAQKVSDVPSPAGIVRGGFAQLALGTTDASYVIGGPPEKSVSYMRRSWQRVRRSELVRGVIDQVEERALAIRKAIPWRPLARKKAPEAIPPEEVHDVEELDAMLLLHALQHIVRHEPSALQYVGLVTLQR